MAKDTQHLRFHGRHWHVVVAVPRHLRSHFGRSQLEHNLRTDSLTEARQGRGVHVAHFKRAIAAAQQEQAGALSPSATTANMPGDPLWWAAYTQDDERLHHRDNNSIAAAHALEEIAAAERLQINIEHGIHAGDDWDGVRRRIKTPLMLHREEWLAGMAVKPKTKRDRRATLCMFEQWASEKEQKYYTVQAINRKVAGDFLAKRLSVAPDGRRLDAETINKHLSALGLYWDWLEERGYLGEAPAANPWRKHKTVTAHSRRKEEYKRPFTDDEVARLLHDGSPGELLEDYMRIAALTGMRIAEIGALKVGDCEGGVFNIRKGKTKAAIRKVPIHSALKSLVAIRSKGRNRDAWLLDDSASGDQRKARQSRADIWDRSMPISKRFGRYRQTVGVHEREDGQAKSAVDFHSFRRWFVTKAEQAGIEPHVVQFIIGHQRGSLTLDRYSGGSSLEQMRGCIEAVKLPTCKSKASPVRNS